MKSRTFLILNGLIFLCTLPCLSQDLSIKIHLRGVSESKLTLLPLSGKRAMKSVAEQAVLKNGETATLDVSSELLPGEFVLRFDYKEKEGSTPYPSEKQIILNNQNLELFVNPPYSNNSDSTWFQKGEEENTEYARFNLENAKKKMQLGLLHNLLMGWVDNPSEFFLHATDEYEKRRSIYNQWILAQAKLHNHLFISHLFRFQFLPKISFNGSDEDKTQSILNHYFDGIDFGDSLLIRTANLKDWMNNYVNLYGSKAKTDLMRDSLLAMAGQTTIEKCKSGNPKVYGWMVDYFYAGYESFGIKKGMIMLQPYLDDPNCLTSKRQQIVRRLESMNRLVAGSPAPDFSLESSDGSLFNFRSYKGIAKLKLLLFWSADCEHCRNLVSQLNQWYQQSGNRDKLDIIAVSVDDTETEIPVWEKAVKDLPGWRHLRAKGGVNSEAANKYAILSTPAMFLVDSKKNVIKSNPDSIDQLEKDVNE